MKLTRYQLRKLIKEMTTTPNPGSISESISSKIETYIMPYKDRVSFEIKSTSLGVDIKMFLDSVEVGYIGADFMGDMCSDCYMVGMASTASGEERNDNHVYGFRLDLIKDDLFKYGNYGPILYELCLEEVSKKDKAYLTCDKNSLDPSAYNVWAYYLYKRPDVITKQLDPIRVPQEFRITPKDPTDDCESYESEQFYQGLTSKLVHPQGPDETGKLEPEELAKKMYGEYTDYVIEKDPIMKGYRKNSTPVLDLIGPNGLDMII